MPDADNIFDLKGFARAFGEACDVRDFAAALRAAIDLAEARRSLAAGFAADARRLAGRLRRRHRRGPRSPGGGRG